MHIEDQESHRLRRSSKRDEAEKAKAAKKEATGRELKKRQAMCVENLTTYRSHSLCKRVNAKRHTAERQQAVMQQKEALRAERKRSKQESVVGQPDEQRKRRALGEIMIQLYTKTK